MDCLEVNEDICRICLDYLDHKVMLNWNEEIFEFCGVSYKDCYYKYTQLDETETDFYPTNLCEMCADELKNAFILAEKALESFNILKITVTSKQNDLKICNPQSNKEYEIYNSNECYSINLSYIINSTDGEKDLIEYQSNVCDNESIAQSENIINNSRELRVSMLENVMMEPAHFTDIQILESPDDISLEQQISESSNTELTAPSDSMRSKTRNNFQTINNISKLKKYDENSDAKLLETAAVVNAENRIKSHKPRSLSSLQQNINKQDNTKSLMPSSNNSINKTRKKYILICQYCSMKVNGTNHLKEHEATHNENRERNETCDQCGIKLYNKIALAEHMKIHRENRQKDHKCEFCEKAFFSKGSLNVHRRIHLGLMVKCQICFKEYCRQVDLNKHMLIHSASPLQKSIEKLKYSVQCHYCNKTVLTKRWKEHKAAHLNQPQTKCKICDKNFYSRSSCRSHIQKVHRKREFDQFIYYYVNPNTRMSHLMMVQQEKVQPIAK